MSARLIPIDGARAARASVDPHRARDIAAIHAAAAALGMDTADKNPASEYRTLLQAIGGATSAAKLSQAGRAAVKAHLARLQGRRQKMTQAEYIGHLWGQLGQAGALKEPGPSGLAAWLQSTCQVSSARFLDTRAGNRAIEALKDWLCRVQTKAQPKKVPRP